MALLLGGTQILAGCPGKAEQGPRKLVPPGGLLGDAPLDNRIFDPRFELTAFGWLLETFGTASMGLYVQEDIPGGGGRALVMQAASSDKPVWLGGVTRLGTADSMHASLWVGVQQGAEATWDTLQVSVVGQQIADGAGGEIALSPDSDTYASGPDGATVVWKRWQGTVAPVFAGWGALYVKAPKGVVVYLADPIVESKSTRTLVAGAARPGTAAAPRPASAEAIRLLEELSRRLR